MAGKGGGAWKVAYADFVTAMMAFFMVMWITSQNQKVKESISRHFSDPYGARDKNGKSGGSSESSPPFNFKDSTRFSIRPKIKMEMHNGREYQVGTTIYFFGTSTELDEEAATALDPMISEVKWNSSQVEINGYANPAPNEVGSIDPWTVAHNRCLVIKEFMESRGVSPQKIKMAQAISYLDTSSDKESKDVETELPDRVEIRIPPIKSKK